MQTGKIYISSHVVFNEKVYPFSTTPDIRSTNSTHHYPIIPIVSLDLQVRESHSPHNYHPSYVSLGPDPQAVSTTSLFGNFSSSHAPLNVSPPNRTQPHQLVSSPLSSPQDIYQQSATPHVSSSHH